MTTYGSLCTGVEMLGAGVESALGPLKHLWQAEPLLIRDQPKGTWRPNPCLKVLSARFPGVPNLGDITAVNWAEVPPVDVLAAGFPCQDVSQSGLRLGLTPATRTGIWSHVALAIATLRPKLVLLENVEGLHSARAHSDLERCPWCMGDDPDQLVLRASGAVLGDLAGIGYDARWITVPASDVGAPHRRKRVFIAAYPADTESLRHWLAGPESGQRFPAAAVGSAAGPGGVALLPTPSAGSFNDGEDLGNWSARRAVAAERHGNNGFGVPLGVAVRMLPTPAARDFKGHGPADLDRNSPNLSAIGSLLPTPRSNDANGVGSHGDGGMDLRTAISLLPTPRATDGTKGGPNQRGSSGDMMLPSAVMLLPTPTTTHSARNATADRSNPKPDTNSNGWTLSDIAYAERWGEYGAAIARWERILDRLAPDPTELGTKGQPRLSPRFVEWMLGLPGGWVTEIPGVSRNDQLRILGNGVVPQQAAYAYRQLLAI